MSIKDNIQNLKKYLNDNYPSLLPDAKRNEDNTVSILDSNIERNLKNNLLKRIIIELETIEKQNNEVYTNMCLSSLFRLKSDSEASLILLLYLYCSPRPNDLDKTIDLYLEKMKKYYEV